MADTTVEADMSAASDFRQGVWGPYYINTTTAVIIGINSDEDVAFWRTTDAGVNWDQTSISTGNVLQLAVWFDQETPGDTGTLVHAAYLEGDGADILYRTVDVSDASLGTERTIDGTITTPGSAPEARIGITKTVGGNLLAAFSTQDEIECYRSVDAGVNWTDRADLFETDTKEDWILMFPANTADNNDACALFWDRSANELSIKMYDDSANTWTETSIAAEIDDSAHMNMDGTIRHSDKHLLVAIHRNDDAANDDLETWDLTVDSIASPTVTAKTDIFTNQGESAQCSIFCNQQNDDVYVAYLKGGTWQSSVDVVFHKSTDDMGTWDSESAYSEATADDFRVVASGRTVGSNGGFYQPAFYNDDTTDIFVNLVNDIAIAVASVGDIRNHIIPAYMRVNS